MKYAIDDRVKLKSIEGSDDLYGTVKGERFGKVLVLLDKLNSIEFEFFEFEFDESALELAEKLD